MIIMTITYIPHSIEVFYVLSNSPTITSWFQKNTFTLEQICNTLFLITRSHSQIHTCQICNPDCSLLKMTFIKFFHITRY